MENRGGCSGLWHWGGGGREVRVEVYTCLQGEMGLFLIVGGLVWCTAVSRAVERYDEVCFRLSCSSFSSSFIITISILTGREKEQTGSAALLPASTFT